MKTKWNQLSDDSIRVSQERMVLRSAIAAPFHSLLFLTAFYSLPEMRAAGFGLYVLFSLVLFTTMGRVVLWRFSAKVFGLSNGRTIWRWIFGILSVGLGLAWGLAEASTFLHYGSRIEYFVILSTCMGIAAASVPAYSFDFVVNVLFQLAINLPPFFVLGLHGGSMFWTLAFFKFLYVIFMSAIALNMHRSQVALMKSQETIEEQKRSIEAAHVELQRNHGLIRTMLESIEEAFLIFDLKGICVSEGSSKAREFFAMDPKGVELFTVLRSPESEISTLRSWYTILASDRMEFEDTALLGPNRFVDVANGRSLKLHYRPMRNADGTLGAVVMTAVDITRELEAQRLEAEAWDRSDLILRVNENRGEFRNFLNHFETTVKGISWTEPGQLIERAELVRHELHTLKGTSSIFGAKAVSREIHDVEMELRALEFESGQFNLGEAFRYYTSAMTRLLERFEVWKHKEMGLFVQLGVFESEKIEVSKRRLTAMEGEFIDESREIFHRILTKMMESELGEQLGDFAFHVEQVASKLGKKAELLVQWEFEPVFARPEEYREVVRSLIHLFNNAIDHGIEIPEERLAKGKPAQGKIVVRYGLLQVDDKPQLRLLIQDDGKGIDVNRLREKAQAKGQSFSDLSDLEVMHTIFDEGISTRDQVTEVSGQGVGMGALRTSVQKARGRISILESQTTGTTFEILLPPPQPIAVERAP